MPYIKKEDRPKFDVLIDQFPDLDAGSLNYSITRLCYRYIKATGRKYLNLAIICGVLITALLELYRRCIAPYEDEKIRENGDVN